jgi:tetratricopeptide (TPR) repeat protein/transcriptional regulator with XRE-family HTH domain
MSADSSGDHETFGSRLRASRLAAGLSQEELAGRSGVSVRTISDLERGRTRWPHPESVARLAEALGLGGARRARFVALAARRLAGPGLAAVSAASAAGVRYSLPPDAAAFTGRQVELDRITAAVTGPAGPQGGMAAIHAIGGMPGVGKTALALHAAHVLKDRFPDRQLFFSLHGHTPGRDPVAPESALAGLLTAVGVDARYLPGGLDGRAALWRDRTAGQRGLLVLDNAASSAQVDPLLPGGGGWLVLVTSRRHLGDLPGAAAPVLLEALPPGEAREMFTRLAPHAADGPPEAVAELAELAGFLPLAVSLLARVCARHPSWTLADLAAETRDRMLTLAAESDSVAAAFAVSYRYLDPARQEFFRCLGLHPGTVIDGYAAAALAGGSLEEATGQLDALHREGLLTEAGRRRYGMHDLIRRYARDLAAADPADRREQALERLLDYYQHTAARAEMLLARQVRTTSPARSPQAPPAGAPSLADSTQALAWARAERGSLLACLDHATAAGQQARVVALTAATASLLRHDGPWADAITRHTTAVAAARQLDDRLGQANALAEVGNVRRLTGDYRGAAEALAEALGIFRGSGDRPGQAGALADLGVVRQLTGDYRGAGEVLAEALGIFRASGDRLGQANALYFLGEGRRMTGDYRGASEVLEEALGIFRGIGSRGGEANALKGLGDVRRMTGDYRGASEVLEEALGILRATGSRVSQANALLYLGIVRRRTGDYRGAGEVLAEALNIYCATGSRAGEANALLYLGDVRGRTGDYRGAGEVLAEALGILRDIGSRGGIAVALTSLGVVRRMTGDYRGAAEALEETLGIYREFGDRGGETEALNETGTLHRVRGDTAQAAQYHRRALDLAREITSPWDEAHALAGLGRCALADGRTGDAIAGLRQAQDIFQRIGAAEAADVAAELGSITATGPATGP